MPDEAKQPTQTAIAPVTTGRAIVHDQGLFTNLMDTARFEHLQRVSKLFANSALVPEHFRGKEADCFIAVEMAMRLQLHPFNLMQSLYVVHGKPGIEAKMAIALINSSGLFEGPLQWTLSGEGMKRQAIARAVHAKTRQVCEALCTMDMAKAEGWLDKSGSKWKTLPDLMLQYRSASFFARLYCPEVIFGMQTREELEEIDVTPQGEPERAIQQAPTKLKDRIGVVTGASLRGAVDAEVIMQQGAANTAGGAPEVTGALKAAAAEVAREFVERGAAATQEAASATQQGKVGDKAPGAPPVAPTAGLDVTGTGPDGAAKPAPAIPFPEALKLAKRAKTKDQADIVSDQMNDPGYTEAEREEVRVILRSKSFAEAGAQ